MSSSHTASMESILDRFDDAWNGPTPPRIEDYLAEAAPDQRFTLLIELVRIDLERRLAAGEKVRLEDNYLPRFPELFAEPPAIVTLAKHEFVVRRRNEPDLMPAEYLARFPQCQTELVAQLSTLDEIINGELQQKTADAPVGLDLRGYELTETLGKGGMGEVYRCVDPALGRDLAIKVMKAGRQSHPEIESRFLREARVTASLQHPGIVPVYNLGRLADGRMHYTMRLVRGQTLAAILREETGKSERLPYLLSIFEKICQAVAYAHSKQVIHRDLKPANVMVGRFGEVQVMDWGLAKLLTAEGGPAQPQGAVEREVTRIFTEAVDTPLEQTRLGREMGTPAYMPPEQALGEWDMVDERADVFSLGSILCAILTGEPAYCGTDSGEVYRLARRGDIAETLQRLQQCGAEAALTELCRDCLSTNREGRPRDGEQVAQRVAAYQAQVQERLRHAEVKRAEARAKMREERKRRRWMIAFLLVLLAGVSASTWQAVRATLAERKARENERQALAERDDKEAALAKAEAATEAERQAKEAEASQRKQAKESEVNMKAVLNFFQDKVLSAGRPQGEAGGQGKDVTLRKAIDAAEPEIANTFVDRPLVEASIRDTLGTTYRYLGDYPLAIQQYERALAVREFKLGADHPDTLNSRNNLAIAYKSAGRIEEAIRLHEQTLKHREAKLGPDHLDALISRTNLADTYWIAGHTAEAIRLLEQTVKQCEAKLGPDHPQTRATRCGLANAYMSARRFAEAIPLLEQTIKQEEAKLGADHPETLRTRSNLAVAYGNADRIAEAIRLHEQAVKQSEAKLGPDHPDTLALRSNLGVEYEKVGRIADAIRLHEQTLRQKEVKLGSDHPNTLISRHNLACAYQSAGRIDEAIRLHQQTLKQFEAKLGPDHPNTLTSRNNLAKAYMSAGRMGEAIRLRQQTLQQREAKLGADHPDTLTSRDNLADAYERAGQLAKSEVLYRAALEQTRKRFGADAPATAGRMAKLGSNLLHQHKYTDAEPVLRDCLKIRKAKQPDLWTTFNTRSVLGEALLGQKKYAEAEPLLLQGYQGMKQRQDKIPPTYRQFRLREALERLTRLYEAMDQKEKAADWLKKLEETKAAQKKPKS